MDGFAFLTQTKNSNANLVKIGLYSIFIPHMKHLARILAYSGGSGRSSILFCQDHYQEGAGM